MHCFARRFAIEILRLLIDLLFVSSEIFRFWRFLLVGLIGAGCIALAYYWMPDGVVRKGLIIVFGHAIVVIGVIWEVRFRDCAVEVIKKAAPENEGGLKRDS